MLRSASMIGRTFWALAALSATVLLAGRAIADEVKVYRPAELKQDEYEPVARLWVETWRPRFWVPTYGSPEDGVAALRDKAAALGADGLIHVGCYPDEGLFSSGTEYLCYGKAIKLRRQGEPRASR